MSPNTPNTHTHTQISLRNKYLPIPMCNHSNILFPVQKWEQTTSRPIFFLIFLFFSMEVQLIYNFVLASGVQQSDSDIHIYTFFFIFFSIMVYHRILNIVPCAIQQDIVFFLLVIYFIHISVYMSIQISQFKPLQPPPAFPPWCPYICSLHL